MNSRFDFEVGSFAKLCGLATFAVLFVTMSVANASAQSLISYWDFNGGFDAGADAVQVEYLADMGVGAMYQQRADIDGNGKGGESYTDAIFGINSSAGRAIAWDDVAKSGANDAELFLVFSTLGYQDIQISFDLQGNDVAGIVSYDLKYDNNDLDDIVDPNGSGTMIKDFAGGNSTTFSNNTAVTTSIDSYMRYSIDLTGAANVDNQSVLAIRFDDIKENDDARFDNFLVTGTAVPEPSSFGFALVGLAGLVSRRSRR